MGLCGNFAHLSTGALIITKCLEGKNLPAGWDQTDLH